MIPSQIGYVLKAKICDIQSIMVFLDSNEAQNFRHPQYFQTSIPTIIGQKLILQYITHQSSDNICIQI